MIGIIDYGMGNLRSVQMGFARVGAQARIIHTPRELAEADKLVLPGVGAFADAIDHIRRQELAGPIVQAVRSGKPFLGICLGLQLLFERSFEDGTHEGLGILAGEVVRFDFSSLPQADQPSVPHMGWNQIDYQPPVAMLDGVAPGSFLYFVHSYYVAPADAGLTLITTDYGGQRFVSAVARANLFATQFHPEKSQSVGLRILKNFAELG